MKPLVAQRPMSLPKNLLFLHKHNPLLRKAHLPLHCMSHTDSPLPTPPLQRPMPWPLIHAVARRILAHRVAVSGREVRAAAGEREVLGLEDQGVETGCGAGGEEEFGGSENGDGKGGGSECVGAFGVEVRGCEGHGGVRLVSGSLKGCSLWLCWCNGQSGAMRSG
jgi:hypothetical protein